ncbi:hypothetical protein B0H19DRAFT_1247342 [Mycena capillaripes]|nr:hypothetical protein B0H19DRAFT_1247342 [Mycena capillaripes]
MSTPITRRSSRALNLPATLLLAGISFIGGFSRITAGQYTPQWYAYQLERAGNTAGTTQGWLIPTMDIILGTLLLPRRTRFGASAAITALFGIGVGMRIAAGKGWAPDVSLLGLAATVLWTSR